MCFRCLNSGHRSRNCKAKCSTYQGDHNSSMCGIKLSLATKANMDNQQNTSSPKTLAILLGNYNTRTVLQTAKVKVVNDKGEIITARLLFDNGCDRSYVSNKFVGKCKPKWVTSTEVPYSSFGGHSSNRDIQNNVQYTN